MKKSRVGLLLILFISIKLNAQNWKPIIEMGNNIFSSYILATANFNEELQPNLPSYIKYIGDPMGVLGMKISQVPENSIVKFEIAETDFFYKSSIQTKINDSNNTYFIYPKVNYKFEYLRNIKQQSPVNVKFNVYLNNELFSTKTITSSVRPIEECPYLTKDYTKNNLNPIPWMFAAYVNEDSPLINDILSKALESKFVNKFNGYNGNAYSQVMAIWYALQNEGIKYSSITDTSLVSNEVYSQKVRMINQSYKHTQANCVDGTVLFASVLKAIGIDPVLIMIPGHMFLGYYTDTTHKKMNFLETTMISAVDLSDIQPHHVTNNLRNKIFKAQHDLKSIQEFKIGRTMTEKQAQIQRQEQYIKSLFVKAKLNASYKTFNMADDFARQKYNLYTNKFGKSMGYYFIDISKSRKYVKPIWK